MEAYRSAIIMEAFRDRFIAAELLAYKKARFEETTKEWYAQRDPVEVDWVESDCIRQAEQFAHLIEEYGGRFFTYVFLQSPKSLAAHLESHHMDRHFTSLLNNKMWGDSRTNILDAIKCKL